MRKFTFIKSLFLAVALLAGNAVWGQGTESFNHTSNSSSYGSITWTGNNGLSWSAADARGDQTITSGNKAICIRQSATGKLTGPLTTTQQTAGIGKITFTAKNTAAASDNTKSTTYQFKCGSVTKTVTIPAMGTNSVIVESPDINSTDATQIEITMTATSGVRVTIDDLSWTAAAPQNVVSNPIISVTGIQKSTDNYYNSATVTLSSTTDGASIYYTTNGDVPTTASTAYTAPFEITATSTIKAIATKTDLDNSAVAEKTITISAPATATVPYTEAFNNTLGNWVTYEVVGAKPWTASANGATVNGYGGVDVESWLISPKFTAVGDGIALAFNYASRYVGNPVSVKMSSNYIGYGNPSAATWTELSSIAAPTVQDNDYTVKASGDIVAATTGTVYFALVYDTDANFSDWRITNATVNNYTIPTAPTLTVTELTVPEMTAVTGLTDTETVNVSGAALTADVLVTIDGADAAMFSVLPASIAQNAGEASGAVTVTYSPTAPGTHTATLKFNSTGATEVTRTLTGTSTMATPVAIDGSGVSQTGFTANWNAVAGATEYELNVYTKQSSSVNASDLFISEYIEGSSNNKAIEIFNGTGADVDLSKYSLKKQSNGADIYKDEYVLTGTLANNDVYVLAHSSANTAIKAVADATTSTSIITFNGNDAVALFKEGVKIDEVGVFNQVAIWGENLTLIRKSSVSAPLSTYNTNEWTTEAQDYATNLGSHTFAGSNVVSTPIAGSPFTVTGETSKAIADLTAGTTYYYTVVAKNGSVATAVSNEIAVTTSTGTGLSNAVKNMNLRAVNGNIVLNAEAGQLVEVYNSIGQKVGSRLTSEGVNTIPARVKGVVFVKIGSEVSKLIME